MTTSHPNGYAAGSVSYDVVEAILRAVAVAGVANRAAVAALGTRLASVAGTRAGPNPRHSDRSLVSLWEAIVCMNGGDHGVGAVVALHADRSALGVLGEVLRQTPTLLEAYAQIGRYSRLVHQGLSIGIDRSPDTISLRYRQSRDTSAHSASALAAGELWAMSYLALFPMRWFNAPIRPVSVQLCAGPPADMGPLAEALGDDVTFHADEPALVYRRSEVETVRRSSEPRILAYLGALAERELRELPAVEDIRAVVAAELQSSLVGGAPTIDVVARSLGLSVRTLQRRITDSGSTFAAILDDLRKRRAEHLIQSRTRSLGEVAYLLGYSEPPALTRAVRRWFGTSPSALAREADLLPR